MIFFAKIDSLQCDWEAYRKQQEAAIRSLYSKAWRTNDEQMYDKGYTEIERYRKMTQQSRSRQL